MTSLATGTTAAPVRRSLIASVDQLEWRKSSNGADYTLTGHAAVFDQWSEELWTFAGTFRERIAAGAFAHVLAQKPDVRLLFNHDGNFALARTKSGTLELTEDDTGLRVWARVAPTSYATDLRLAMQRGDIDQMSFAFTVGEDEWHEDHDTEQVERTILRVDELFDVSVVTFPAYPDTDATMRELRAAADAGWIAAVRTDADTPRETKEEPVAQPETDAADTADSRVEDPDGEKHSAAPAETDLVAGEAEALADLKRASREAAQEGRETYLRLLKEMQCDSQKKSTRPAA